MTYILPANNSTASGSLLDRLALLGIKEGYQRFLSPAKYWLGHKGCSFRIDHERQNQILAADGQPLIDARSCSVFAAQTIAAVGTKNAIPLIQARFRLCHASGRSLGRHGATFFSRVLGRGFNLAVYMAGGTEPEYDGDDSSSCSNSDASASDPNDWGQNDGCCDC